MSRSSRRRRGSLRRNSRNTDISRTRTFAPLLHGIASGLIITWLFKCLLTVVQCLRLGGWLPCKHFAHFKAVHAFL
jgi:hypothetical protein